MWSCDAGGELITGNQRTGNGNGWLLEEQPHSKDETCEGAEDKHPHAGGLKDLDLLPSGMRTGMALDVQDVWPEEMYVPGLVIHLVKEEEPSEQSALQTFCHFMGCSEESQAQYYAVLKNRKKFQDIVVSPNMFIDHAPWR